MTDAKLYLFDQWDGCTGFIRDAQGLIRRTCEDELPENLQDDSDHGVMLVWNGEILDASALTEAECDEKGIPFHESRGCNEWWQGSMRSATDSEILSVFSTNRTETRVVTDAMVARAAVALWARYGDHTVEDGDIRAMLIAALTQESA
jgi:hypothetical protein